MTPYASVLVDEVGTGAVIPDDVFLMARDYLEYSEERNQLNEAEDWDGAYEVECSQRDLGMDIATWIEENYTGGA